METGQVMITFDDGILSHYDAAEMLGDRGLKGVFGLVGKRFEQPGYLTSSLCAGLSEDYGHFFCNHSGNHWWSGAGQPKPGQTAHAPHELIADCVDDWMGHSNDDWFHPDYLMVPYGSPNILNSQLLEALVEKTKWIRLTTGTPLPESLGEGRWTIKGHRRYYPKDYSGHVIGITEAGDVRWPDGVKEAATNAANLGVLAVLIYYGMTDVVGSGMDITLERFKSDMDFIADLVKQGKLECVTPDQLIKDSQ